MTRTVPMPAFGHADLSNCEREQIHLAGSIQPHGALLLVRESDRTILQTSANFREFLGASVRYSVLAGAMPLLVDLPFHANDSLFAPGDDISLFIPEEAICLIAA